MKTAAVTRAWLQLLLLSAASVFLAAWSGVLPGPTATGALVLVIAWLKARVILSRYLGLWQAPSWQSGFNWGLGIYCLVLLGLFLAPGLTR
ncbi:cytochrome C oxidase subunit IV family protein [Roseibium sp. Sym1]|uniref:cytochrome C oxidase subunit IV family protein n=1 Tax=Roseibium sp. Sym1 TaxID=3016006 RepID=UPI0022B5BD5C|nr:cytochrome C oxidase subunit IV family protein [Roseibium sp. Sym1]